MNTLEQIKEECSRIKYSRYFYFDNDGNLTYSEGADSVPQENWDKGEGVTISGAFRFVQKLGCVGWNQHKIRDRDNHHRCCLSTLRWAVKNVGEIIPVVYRGVQDDRPESDHQILFGSPDIKVAQFYGDTVKTYFNVKGFLSEGIGTSVVTGDYSYIDKEVVFFPGGFERVKL